MSTRFLLLALFAVFLGVLPGLPQSSSPTSAADSSHEAAVIEILSMKVVFDNQGNATREQVTRVHVLTDAGVKAWGLLVFPYQSATQQIGIDYVRVRKADGSVVTTSADNEQDLDSEITRSAPFYSDLRERHIAVKGLGSGDTLEYAAHWSTTKPLIPGQFWFQYNFQHDAVVLNERLEVKVPVGRSIKVKGPQATQTVSTDAGMQVYAWTFSRPPGTKDPKDDEKTRTEAIRGRFPSPDVQISSFQSWDEVGRWYWNLQHDRTDPSEAVRAKAAEITRGLTTDEAKLRAIYKFVSTQYRYIGIAFGIGRYQPHAADDVLTNNYGDCKDKHTLLTSLLQASGITIYPALISSNRVIDPDMPSPAQFDHVIGYVPQAKLPLWLDTTAEVAPMGFLMPQLRDKPALVISGDGTAKLINTPADPPMRASANFRINAKLAADGTLEAQVEDTTEGENAVLIREAFRRVPQSQWNDLVQQISYQLGFAGTVSDATASQPESIDDPFHFSYSYKRKDYPDWGDRRFLIPGLPFGMPGLRDDAKSPVWLGPPHETISDSTVELPSGYTPLAPENVDLNFDFAEYHASYSQHEGKIIAKRDLVIKLHEVPATELEQYRGFLKKIQDDLNQYIQTSSSSASLKLKSSEVVPPRVLAFMNRIRELPESNSPEANNLESDARDLMRKNDAAGAITSLQRAVSIDPKFARAWVYLGFLLIGQKQTAAGIDAFHKAMETAPEETAIPKSMGYSLMSQQKVEEAVPVWQQYIKAHPEDVDGPSNLANCLVVLKRYKEAAEALETVAKTDNKRPDLQLRLASVYLRAGEREKAADAFKNAGTLDTEKKYLNDAAYEMANNDLQLPLALEYAKTAVRDMEEESHSATLQDLKMEDLQRTFPIAAYWDTLGWVNERMSNMPDAERYLRASWRLTQDAVVAGHLCHLYKRMHQTTRAIQMCNLAVARMPLSTQLNLQDFGTETAAAQENLNHLTNNPKSTGSFDSAGFVVAERTFKLPRFLPGTESAEFFVLFEADPKAKVFKVKETKFISGSEKMRSEGRQLKTINFNFPAPDDAPTHFVWRGILGCYQYSGCSFVVLDPASVHSLN